MKNYFLSSLTARAAGYSLCAALLLALAARPAAAQTIRRVNNTGISGPNIYNTIQAAHDAAAAGDIIQVEPSGVDYGFAIIDKNVSIVGPGYFLDPTTQNVGLQANPLPATLRQLFIKAGGAGAYIAGLTVGFYRVEASNVTIQRCRITQALYVNDTGQNGTTAQTLTGIIVKQNYIDARTFISVNNFGVDNLLIVNNIFPNGTSLATNFNGGFFNNVVPLTAVNSVLNNFTVANNYFDAALDGVGNTLSNNISASSSFPTTNGNQANVPQSAVFVLAPGTTAFDGWYVLKSGTNPARGAGQGGTDVGIFGGNTPYKLGGLPAIPAIYQQTQTIVGNSLNVTLSVRSNN